MLIVPTETTGPLPKVLAEERRFGHGTLWIVPTRANATEGRPRAAVRSPVSGVTAMGRGCVPLMAMVGDHCLIRESGWVDCYTPLPHFRQAPHPRAGAVRMIGR
jgi:hypothetical protein